MQNIRNRYKITTLLFFTFLAVTMLTFSGQAKAQNVSVNAKLDSTLMFIGGQMNLTLEVNQPKDVNIVFPVFTDTITKAIEVVSSTPVDTTFLDNNRITLKQQYRITSFDSGLQYVPPIKFELAQEEYHKIFETKPMAVMVIDPFDNVDPKKGIADIKAPLDAPFTLAELLPYLPWILLALAVIGAGIYLFFRFRNRKGTEQAVKKKKPKEPPHVIALRELNRIKAEKLWQKGQVKKYHTEITDTLRQFIEDRFEINALEQTTEETLQALKNVDLNDEEAYKKLKQILELADLVKFAKFNPLPDENDLSMINALFFVNQTKKEPIKSLEEQKKSVSDGEAEKSGEKSVQEETVAVPAATEAAGDKADNRPSNEEKKG